jgi:hypothetical protein
MTELPSLYLRCDFPSSSSDLTHLRHSQKEERKVGIATYDVTNASTATSVSIFSRRRLEMRGSHSALFGCKISVGVHASESSRSYR